jgi:hypothetical protein
MKDSVMTYNLNGKREIVFSEMPSIPQESTAEHRQRK